MWVYQLCEMNGVNGQYRFVPFNESKWHDMTREIKRAKDVSGPLDVGLDGSLEIATAEVEALSVNANVIEYVRHLLRRARVKL